MISGSSGSCLDARRNFEIGQEDLLDKVHIRSYIGAVDCSNKTISVVAELGFPKSHDKAVAQMSFVSQLPLYFRAYELRGLHRPYNQKPEEPDIGAKTTYSWEL
jgi:hypothetical protein